MSVNRRDFLRRAAGVASAAALAGKSSLVSAQTESFPLRRFWHRAHRRGDDGEPQLRSLARLAAGSERPAGGARLSGQERRGSPYHRLTTFAGCSHPDQDHSYAEVAANTTTAIWMGGCAPPRMTYSASATTRRRICPSSARWHAITPPWKLFLLHPRPDFSQPCFSACGADGSAFEHH